jgi:hypothetical protein
MARADNAVSAIACGLYGVKPDEDMVEDLAQLIENGTSDVHGVIPDLATDQTIRAVHEGLAEMPEHLTAAFQWLCDASVDQMADAVANAVPWDELISNARDRDRRGLHERWRNIGQMTPLIAVKPEKLVAATQMLTAFREADPIVAPPPSLVPESET